MRKLSETNDNRIAGYARAMAKVIIELRAEGTAWARGEAERLAGIAQERCREMRAAARR